ncbi:metallophosphoesterase [Magnetovibrio sp. PR-2]|uniref:metallophosphoesterase n=1 Tax=Magnetovibrio sp. PR-2 TaxID=3120356 RepID=UPI002FCE1D1E
MMTNNPIKVFVASDLHLEFEFVAPPTGPELGFAPGEVDLILLSGDIWTGAKTAPWICKLAEKQNTPVCWIAGNHEFYGQKIEKTLKGFRETCANHPLAYFLESESVTLEIHGRPVRVIGCTLWTDFDLNGQPKNAKEMASYGLSDYRKITEDARAAAGIYTRFKPEHAQRRHFVSRMWLQDELSAPFSGVTIVMTHHAPHPNSVSGTYKKDELTPAYASDLTEMLTEHDVDLWTHGHVHESFDYEIGGTRIVSNTYGYFAEDINPRFDNGKIVEV